MRIKLKVKLIDISKVALYWEVQPEAKEDVNNYLYNVQISGSKEGPWENVNPFEIQNAYGYIDTKTQRGHMDTGLYYRIEATSLDKSKQFYSNAFHIEEENLNYAANFISKQEKLVLRRMSGSKALLFPRIKFGKRCDCFDPISRKSKRQNCADCYSTTYAGGFFNPTLIYINRDIRVKDIDKSEYGVTEQANVSGWTSNDAIVEPDDIVVFLGIQTERFLVDKVIPTSIAGATVRQGLQLIQQRLDSEVYSLPVDMEVYELPEYNIFRRSYWNK